MLLKHLVVMLVAVGWASWVSSWLTRAGMTLPAYIGAMLVAAVIRNLDDATGMFGMSQRVIDDIGNVALSLFLVMAMMTLRLWELAGLATPLLVILAAQVALIAVFCLSSFRASWAATTSGGHLRRVLRLHAGHHRECHGEHGRAGRALRTGAESVLVVPLVGAFFIDFANALLITFFLNLWR